MMITLDAELKIGPEHLAGKRLVGVRIMWVLAGVSCTGALLKVRHKAIRMLSSTGGILKRQRKRKGR